MAREPSKMSHSEFIAWRDSEIAKAKPTYDRPGQEKAKEIIESARRQPTREEIRDFCYTTYDLRPIDGHNMHEIEHHAERLNLRKYGHALENGEIAKELHFLRWVFFVTRYFESDIRENNKETKEHHKEEERRRREMRSRRERLGISSPDPFPYEEARGLPLRTQGRGQPESLTETILLEQLSFLHDEMNKASNRKKRGKWVRFRLATDEESNFGNRDTVQEKSREFGQFVEDCWPVVAPGFPFPRLTAFTRVRDKQNRNICFDKPGRISDAPGLRWDKRKNGWAAMWIANRDFVEIGFKPSSKMIKNFKSAPRTDDKEYVRAECVRLQDEMYAFRGKPSRK